MKELQKLGLYEGPPIGRRNKDEIKNIDEFWNHYIHLLNKELYKYEWELPDTCDECTWEMTLIHEGKALFMIDPDDNLPRSVKLLESNIQTIYKYPKEGFGWALNYNKPVILYVPGEGIESAKARGVNGVVVYANRLHYPNFFYLESQAARMAESTRAMDVALENLKTPYIVATDKNNLKTIKDAIKEKRNNNDAIILSADILQNGELPLEVYPLGTTPQVLDAMWQHYYNIEEETRCRQGLKGNPAPDKKERMITGEVEANDAVTYVNDDIGLLTRQEGVDIINELFAEYLDKPVSVSSRFQSIQEEYDAEGSENDSDNQNVSRETSEGGEQNE